MSYNGVENFINQLAEDKLTDNYYFKHLEEERLRKSSPALQNAWEQYQVVLQLVQEQNNVETNDGTDGAM